MKNNHSLNYVVEQIKERIDILEIAQEHGVILKRNGKGLIQCTFHSDRSPSFSISSQKKIFKCFGCGIGGDVIRLYALFNNISNGQAIKRLGERIGLSNTKPLPKLIKRKLAKQTKDKFIEKRFLEDCNQVFNDLCYIRSFMRELAGQYKFMDLLERDSLIVQYYHEKGAHQCLIDDLLESLQEELIYEHQIKRLIDLFIEGKGVVARWADSYYRERKGKNIF